MKIDGDSDDEFKMIEIKEKVKDFIAKNGKKGVLLIKIKSFTQVFLFFSVAFLWSLFKGVLKKIHLL